MSADASIIDHEAAAAIARGLGSTYTTPTDAAVKAVFAAYLSLRNPRDDGQYLDRASLLARIEALTTEVGRWEAMAKNVQAHRLESDRERDAAKADAARLQEELFVLKDTIDAAVSEGIVQHLDHHALDVWSRRIAFGRDRAEAALAATDSGAWLQQRIDAETEPLRKRIAELEARP